MPARAARAGSRRATTARAFRSAWRGRELLDKLRAQATGYGARDRRRLRREARTRRRRVHRHRRRTARAGARRYVLLATGVVDAMPSMPGLEDAIARNVDAHVRGVRWRTKPATTASPCTRRSMSRSAHAVFLRTFSRSVVAVRSEPGEPTDENARACASRRASSVLPVAKSLRTRRPLLRLPSRRRQRAPLRYRVPGARLQGAVATGHRARRGGRRQRRAASSTSASRPTSTAFTRSATSSVR